MVFASTGLRVDSCQMLKNAVELFLSVRGWEIPEGETNDVYLNEELLEFAFAACQNIPGVEFSKGY